MYRLITLIFFITVLKITQLQTDMTAIVNQGITEKEVLENEIAGEENTTPYTVHYSICWTFQLAFTCAVNELTLH